MHNCYLVKKPHQVNISKKIADRNKTALGLFLLIILKWSRIWRLTTETMQAPCWDFVGCQSLDTKFNNIFIFIQLAIHSNEHFSRTSHRALSTVSAINVFHYGWISSPQAGSTWINPSKTKVRPKVGLFTHGWAEELQTGTSFSWLL